MSLRSVNLNLLPTLNALLRERNLSRAAQSLALSQPAVSAALTRLRQIFNDPLLVREGRGMALTLMAHDLIEPVEKICADLENLFDVSQFEPSTSTKRFVIICADYAVFSVAPKILEALKHRAPGISLHFADTPHHSLEFHAGEADFFILPSALLARQNDDRLRWSKLNDDDFVMAMKKDHPLSKHGIESKEDLAKYRFIKFHPALSKIEDPLLQQVTGFDLAENQNVTLIQQFSLMPYLVSETDAIAVLPRSIAEYMKTRFPIAIVDNSRIPSRMETALCWNIGAESDPAHRWMRRLILEQTAED